MLKHIFVYRTAVEMKVSVFYCRCMGDSLLCWARSVFNKSPNVFYSPYIHILMYIWFLYIHAANC